MLLLSALLLTTSYSPELADNSTTRVSEFSSNRIEATPVSVTTISSEELSRMPNPRDPGSVLDAIRTVELSTQGIATRGESLSGPRGSLFQGMQPVTFSIDAIPTAPLNVADLTKAINEIEVIAGPSSTNSGALALYGTHSQTMNWLRNQSRSPTFEAPQEPDRWRMYDYPLFDNALKIEVKIEQVTHYPSIDLTEREEIRSLDVALGYYSLPYELAATQTDIDPADTWASDDPYDWQIGGISFRDPYSQQLGVASLTLPYKAFTPKFEVTTSPAQYILDAGALHPRAQYFQDLINRSGYDMPQISTMMRGAAAQGNSMNTLRFPGDPSLLDDVDCGSELFYPAGTLWVPDDAEYQLMTNFQPFKYRFDLESSRSGPMSLTQEQVEFRSHCLNMEKKQPAAGVRYYPYYSPDPVIRALMIMTNNTRFRGPWLQAQTWIYTDKASLEEINELLIPAVNPARYVEGLYAVAMAGGFTNQDYLNAAMFNPALLSAILLRPEVAYWMMIVMAEHHAEATRRWFENSGGNIGTILRGEDAQAKSAIMNLIALAIYSPTPTIRMGVLMLLDRLENAQGLLPGLPTPHYSLASEDDAEVALAEKVVEKYSLK